jgi:hypothetical protein
MNTTSTSSLPLRASFLGIPCELRLLIYDKVICLDIDFCIERASPASTSRNQSLGARWDGACELPINKLALVCRSITKEIRSHARLLPSSQRVACIELRARALFLYGIFLRRLPCRIRQVSGLDLEVRLDLPQAMRRDYVQQWVANKVDGLRDTLFHLLHPEDGILKDATGIRHVWIYLESPTPMRSRLSDDVADEIKREIRAQAERQVVGLVRPKLAGRTLYLMWNEG